VKVDIVYLGVMVGAAALVERIGKEKESERK